MDQSGIRKLVLNFALMILESMKDDGTHVLAKMASGSSTSPRE